MDPTDAVSGLPNHHDTCWEESSQVDSAGAHTAGRLSQCRMLEERARAQGPVDRCHGAPLCPGTESRRRGLSHALGPLDG